MLDFYVYFDQGYINVEKCQMLKIWRSAFSVITQLWLYELTILLGLLVLGAKLILILFQDLILEIYWALFKDFPEKVLITH